MKALIFHIGRDRYGLRLSAIHRVVPVLEMKQLPLAPDYVAGIMDLHGRPVPVLDLSRLAGLAPGPAYFDSRIVIVDYAPADGSARLLGLLAEHVLGTADVDAGGLAESGLRSAPFLGQVASQEQGMLQLVEVNELLAPDVRALLFPVAEPAS